MTRALHRAAAFLHRLGRDRQGAILVLGLFGLLLTAATSMFIVDLARIQIARARLQSAADAAMLAAARDLGESEAILSEIAAKVFWANMAERPADLVISDVRLTVSGGLTAETGDTVRLVVDARLPLLMAGVVETLRLTNIASVDLDTTAAARKRVMGAEIMMVLDNTGSMNGQPIKDLRAAATELTNAVFDGQENVPNVYMGLVNYAATVNIGRQHASWTGRSLADIDTQFDVTPWKGCVRVRKSPLPGGHDWTETDEPPHLPNKAADSPNKLFTVQFWPSSRLSTSPDVFDSYYNADKAHANIWPPLDKKKPKVDEKQTAGNSGYGPNLGCPAPITPLTASRTAILGAITHTTTPPSGIDAWHRGGTFGNVGLAWGWRALSPRWTGLWKRADGTVLADLPLPADTPFHNKIIVMMTDGANGHFQTDMTAYGRPDELIKKGDIDKSMLRLCQSIKDAGIIVYTITFGSVNDATRTTYTNCASNPATEERIVGQKYFHAPSGAELQSVFRRIGGQISELRLVE
jgi:Flp pilus assembly protein TadG